MNQPLPLPTNESNNLKGYASKAQTEELLKRGRDYMAWRLSRKDILSADEYAKKYSIHGPAQVKAFVDCHHLLGVYFEGHLYLPVWQVYILDKIKPLLVEAGGNHMQVFNFLENHHDALEGLLGRQALEQGFSERQILEAFHDH